jgi:hypothetical protein
MTSSSSSHLTRVELQNELTKILERAGYKVISADPEQTMHRQDKRHIFTDRESLSIFTKLDLSRNVVHEWEFLLLPDVEDGFTFTPAAGEQLDVKFQELADLVSREVAGTGRKTLEIECCTPIAHVKRGQDTVASMYVDMFFSS